MNIGREQRQQITYNSGERQKRRAATKEGTNNDVEAWHKVIMIPYLTSINRFAVRLYRNITKANLLFAPLPSDRGHSSARPYGLHWFSRQSDTPVHSAVITKGTSCNKESRFAFSWRTNDCLVAYHLKPVSVHLDRPFP